MDCGRRVPGGIMIVLLSVDQTFPGRRFFESTCSLHLIPPLPRAWTSRVESRLRRFSTKAPDVCRMPLPPSQYKVRAYDNDSPEDPTLSFVALTSVGFPYAGLRSRRHGYDRAQGLGRLYH